MQMSEMAITVTIIVAGLLAAILLWQVLEIGKERAREGEGQRVTELERRVEGLEGRVEGLEGRVEALESGVPGRGR